MYDNKSLLEAMEVIRKVTLATEAMEVIRKVTLATEAMESIRKVTLATEAMESIRKAALVSEPFRKEIKAMESVTKAFVPDESLRKQMEVAESMTKAFLPSNSLLKEMERMESITKSFLPDDSLRKAMEAMKGVSLQGAMKALNDQSTFKFALESFTRSYDSSDLAGLSASAQIHEEFNGIQVGEAIKQLESIEDGNSFKKTFPRLPISVQAIILGLFRWFIIPLILSILANMLTPHVQKYFADNKKPKREQVKAAKKFTLKENNLATNHLRFITGDNVRLRLKPSTSSAILDELVIGKVVKIVGKKKNWIKVECTSEDGGILIGWVFTRYTAKFKN